MTDGRTRRDNNSKHHNNTTKTRMVISCAIMMECLATHTAPAYCDVQVSKWSVLGCAITLFGVAMYNRGK